MSEGSRQIAEELLEQTKRDEKRRTDSIKIDEKPIITEYDGVYPNLSAGNYIDFQERNKIRPRNNPNEKED